MDRNLENYIKIYNNWIDDKICKETIVELENHEWNKHLFYSPKMENVFSPSGSKEFDITYVDCDKTQYIMKRIWDSLSKYISELEFPWFSDWNGFEFVRFNRYNEGQLMANHCDPIHSLFDGKRKGVPILTILGSLNDDYDGGDFLMWDKKIELKAGDIIIFPSNFLYPHMGSEVTKGKRYTFVSWAW